MAAPHHGGDLREAMALARAKGSDPGTMGDWLDLSTGINPNAYPVADIRSKAWHSLPGSSEMEALLAAACDYYGASSTDHILAVPGTALAIQMIPRLFADFDLTKPAMVVSPTYGDHERAWRAAGREIVRTPHIEEADFDGLSILVNPNNPTGAVCVLDHFSDENRVWSHEKGWLIVDEAFGDVVSGASVAHAAATDNVIVLKSLGKFFGLAGLRLGFVIAPPLMIEKLASMMGAWAVSGPAIHMGIKALADREWQAKTRAELQVQSDRLFALFSRADLNIAGGTSLFALLDDPSAQKLFDRLLKHRIYVRRFDYNENWLRFGLPDGDAAFSRLETALMCR